MNELLELVFAGLALGAQYALIVLGFVVIYRATGVINFAQGGLLILGAYLAFNAYNTWDLPWYASIVVAMAGGAVIGALVEVLILRRMVGQPVFAVILITLGLFIVFQEIASSIWGSSPQPLGDPWDDTFDVGGLVIESKNVATLILAAIVLAAFFLLFRYTRIGIAMRASALDQEAAMAQGISARLVFALSWGIAGAVAALAGIAGAAGPSSSVRPELGLVALFAFPAMILGGLDSPGGAVLGGIIIGVTQTVTQGWENGILDFLPTFPEVLGEGFDRVMPYVVMVVILLVRPFGLFGTREVRRV